MCCTEDTVMKTHEYTMQNHDNIASQSFSSESKISNLSSIFSLPIISSQNVSEHEIKEAIIESKKKIFLLQKKNRETQRSKIPNVSLQNLERTLKKYMPSNSTIRIKEKNPKLQFKDKLK